MKNIIQFPTQLVRDWLTIEESMIDALKKLNASKVAHERIIRIMKNFFQETLNFQLNLSTTAKFPGSLSASEVSDICSEIGDNIGASSSKQLQTFTKALFLERLHREIEICRELGIL